MKNAVRLAVALAALGLAVPAVAQQQPTRPTLGFGVAVFPLDGGGTLAGDLYLPIRLAPEFRLEPSLGINTRDVNGGTDTRDITLGVGAFWVKPVAAAVDMYVGGRLKLNFAHSSGPAGSDSDTDVILAAALGGEYYLVPQFSVGLEGQLGLYQHGAINGDDSGFFTNGLAFLRLYFH